MLALRWSLILLIALTFFSPSANASESCCNTKIPLTVTTDGTSAIMSQKTAFAKILYTPDSNTIPLMKLVPYLKIDGNLVPISQASKIELTEVTGSIKANLTVADVNIMMDFTPLLKDPKSEQPQGAAFFYIKTEPNTPVVINYGNQPATADIDDPNVYSTDKFEVNRDSVTYITSELHPYTIGLRSEDTKANKIITADNLAAGQLELPAGKGAMFIVYTPDLQTTAQKIYRDYMAERRNVIIYHMQKTKRASSEKQSGKTIKTETQTRDN